MLFDWWIRTSISPLEGIPKDEKGGSATRDGHFFASATRDSSIHALHHVSTSVFPFRRCLATRNAKRNDPFWNTKGGPTFCPPFHFRFVFSSSEDRLRIFLARLISQSGLPVERAIPPPRSFEISLYGSRERKTTTGAGCSFPAKFTFKRRRWQRPFNRGSLSDRSETTREPGNRILLRLDPFRLERLYHFSTAKITLFNRISCRVELLFYVDTNDRPRRKMENVS